MTPRMGTVALLVVIAVALCSTAATAATEPSTANQPNGRYLVVFKADTLPSDATRRVVSCGGTVARAFRQIGVVSATGNAAFAKTIAKDAKVLSVGPEHMFAAPDVQAVELTDDMAVPESAVGPVSGVDVYYPYQWDIRRVGAPAVWARLPLSPETPRVAVLDLGVMDDHPDLAGQVDTSVADLLLPDGRRLSGLRDVHRPPHLPELDALGRLHRPGRQLLSGPRHARSRNDRRQLRRWQGRRRGAWREDRRLQGVDAYTVDGIYLNIGAFDGPIFDAIIQATVAGYRVISMSLGSYGVRNDKDDNASWLAWDRVAKWANRNGALIVASAATRRSA